MPINNIYETRTMLEAIQHIPSNEQFLQSTFVRGRNTFPTESFDIDIVKGKKVMAPFVATYKNGVMLSRGQITTLNYKPVKIQPKRPVTVETLAQRLAGEALYSGKTPAQRKQELLAKDMSDLDGSIRRRWEWMIAQILTTGGFTAPVMADESTVYDEIEFDYGHDQQTVLDGAKKWSVENAATSDPIEDLKAMCETVADGCGEYPTIAIFGADAVKGFLASDKVKELFDNRRIHVGDFEPTIKSKHVKVVCRLIDPAIEVYQYAESYVDDENATHKFIPANKVVVSCENIFDMNFGAVTQMESDEEFHTYMGEIVPKVSANRDEDALTLTMTSRPIPVPFDVNAWGIIDI